MAILGQMRITDGVCASSRESLAYVAQEPWIFSDTVRNNILFGEEMDVHWYNEVIKGCCLEQVSGFLFLRNHYPHLGPWKRGVGIAYRNFKSRRIAYRNFGRLRIDF